MADLPVARAAGRLDDLDAIGRCWARDHTLWADDPTEISDRLGWLDAADRAAEHLDDLRAFAGEVRGAGFTRVVWCGMGGSSLFPLVLAAAFAGPDGIALEVLDTSHPGAVARATAGALDTTLFAYASKSGSTVETRSHLAHCWDALPDPAHHVAVTDAGSSLDTLATERGFRRVFHAQPDVGGRFSALTHFGLVPAALLGVDLDLLVDGARAMLEQCRARNVGANPGATLAAFLGGHAASRCDKCTLDLRADLGPFGAWLEQLVAESTGKHGVGILPVDGEPLGPPGVYGDDRAFVRDVPSTATEALADAGHPLFTVEPDGAGVGALGAEVARWELAVALTGVLLRINPFDQPDVETAKRAAARALETGPLDVPVGRPGHVLDRLRPGDYVAIQAYLDPADPALGGLQRARVAIRDRRRVATTLGLGPRYLHSTGQLHKGGPDSGVFLQVLDETAGDVAVPGTGHGFAALLRAQADGDHAALAERGRRVVRVALDDLVALGA
jgi:glucose-6-phosphate isomerase